MWVVKRIYQRNTLGDEDFIRTVVDFVKTPKEGEALHRRALQRMGLMQAMPLPDDILKKIATYILEEDFPPPCVHWKNGVETAHKAGEMEQARKEQRQLERFCQ